MRSTGLELLIAALVAATFGFGGVESPLTRPARALSLVLFIGFGYCLIIAMIEARYQTPALKREPAGDATRTPFTT